MEICEEIMKMVAQADFVLAPVTETSNLYTDLGYDSLAFISLLLKIEEAYFIKFELLEMGECIRVDRLIALTRQKTAEAMHD